MSSLLMYLGLVYVHTAVAKLAAPECDIAFFLKTEGNLRYHL